MSTQSAIERPTGPLPSTSVTMSLSNSDLDLDRSICSSKVTEPSTCSSDGVMINNPGSTVKDLNVTNSKRIFVGSQFLTDTQNVKKYNLVKDLPFHRYIWEVARNTSKSEKAFCVCVMLALILCTVLIIYFYMLAARGDDNSALEPEDWFINREKWFAIKYNTTVSLSGKLRLVVVAHTTGPFCTNFVNCTIAVKNLQKYYIESLGYDIPYNFLIGGDGRVYEGRGWKVRGAHTGGYNNCSMGLAFIGDYRIGNPSYSNLTNLQQQRALILFEEGASSGHLHPQFQVLGAKDLRPTESPGANVYEAIKKWPNYNHENIFKHMDCRQIQELYETGNDFSNRVDPNDA